MLLRKSKGETSANAPGEKQLGQWGAVVFSDRVTRAEIRRDFIKEVCAVADY
jgi:hypothetical protein